MPYRFPGTETADISLTLAPWRPAMTTPEVNASLGFTE